MLAPRRVLKYPSSGPLPWHGPLPCHAIVLYNSRYNVCHLTGRVPLSLRLLPSGLGLGGREIGVHWYFFINHSAQRVSGALLVSQRAPCLWAGGGIQPSMSSAFTPDGMYVFVPCALAHPQILPSTPPPMACQNMCFDTQ